MTGRSYQDDQVNFIQNGHGPFAYGALTRLPFTNQVLRNTYDARYGPGVSETFVDSRLYIGREDGIGDATDEIIGAQRSHGARVDVADIILCTGAQHTDETALKRGIENAYSLLKEAGILLIRSLAHPAMDEIGTNQITEWAFEAGFPEDKAFHYEAKMHQLSTLVLEGHFSDRDIKTVILTK